MLRIASNEKYDAFSKGNVGSKIQRSSQIWHGFLQVNYICVYASAKDKLTHPWASQASMMTIVTSCSLRKKKTNAKENFINFSY